MQDLRYWTFFTPEIQIKPAIWWQKTQKSFYSLLFLLVIQKWSFAITLIHKRGDFQYSKVLLIYTSWRKPWGQLKLPFHCFSSPWSISKRYTTILNGGNDHWNFMFPNFWTKVWHLIPCLTDTIPQNTSEMGHGWVLTTFSNYPQMPANIFSYRHRVL